MALLLLAGPVGAQTNVGYAIGSPMLQLCGCAHDPAWSAAAGVEKIETSGAAAGAEFGRLYVPGGRFRSPASATTATFNGSYHWLHRDRTQMWQPFVTGGVMLTGSGAGYFLIDLGGGVDRWMTRHVGVRLEARDHFSCGNVFFGTRAGVVFR